MMLEDSRKQRYKKKLEKLESYQHLFRKWFESYKSNQLNKGENFEKIFAIYHSIQLIIEVITDIVGMMVKDLSLIVEDNYSNFEKLLNREIISSDLFQGLKNLNGLRNRIVHDYNGIIDEVVWDSIEENEPYIEEFKEMVRKWLIQKG
ncbi:MAG: DUF86 domain-containing protein [Candidatus Lokiarchaeota archaeon]|nr:DUF86 domain-containing protein [Candidatus Lokiarchaeota archaeon]MBD3340771.1 DUF86 domain-containing protein [Candidatus Lokiarchaeota archaeon]